jgi:putative ABC transport system permease protein
MFFRLLMESFRRQRRRKMLAGIAILLGTTAVTAMLALATTIGDRIHKELAVYGANIVVYPKADLLDVKIGGVDVKPTTGGVYLKESDLEKLKTIFWANNIMGVSPELRSAGRMANIDYFAGLKVRWIPAQYVGSIPSSELVDSAPVDIVGYWFDHPFGTLKTGAPQLHPWWKLQGRWPSEKGDVIIANSDREEVVLGSKIAQKFDLHIGDDILLRTEHLGRVVGIVTTGDQTDESVLYALDAIAPVMHQIQGSAGREKWSSDISRVEVSARTKPEDAFARLDPDSLSPQKREIWYCRPYANSIAYQIREAIPGAEAGQVRRVEQSEGNVLSRISGLMWLVSAAALLAAGFAVSAAMATAVLERRGEIGLMRSLGASRGAIALLFYAESGLLAVLAGSLGYLVGSGLAAWLGARIFSGDGGSGEAILNPVLLPIVVALALVVAIAGSTPSIRAALRMDPSAILRADA